MSRFTDDLESEYQESRERETGVTTFRLWYAGNLEENERPQMGGVSGVFWDMGPGRVALNWDPNWVRDHGDEWVACDVEFETWERWDRFQEWCKRMNLEIILDDPWSASDIDGVVEMPPSSSQRESWTSVYRDTRTGMVYEIPGGETMQATDEIGRLQFLILRDRELDARDRDTGEE